MEGLAIGGPALRREDDEGNQRADDAGHGDGGDAGPDHGRRIPGERPRGARGRGQIERYHVDERVNDLVRVALS